MQYNKKYSPLHPCFCGNRFCRFWNIYPRSCKNDVSYKLPCLQCKLLDMFTNNMPCLQRKLPCVFTNNNKNEKYKQPSPLGCALGLRWFMDHKFLSTVVYLLLTIAHKRMNTVIFLLHRSRDITLGMSRQRTRMAKNSGVLIWTSTCE